MKSFNLFASFSSLAGIASATVQGFDISHYQGSVNFGAAYADGARFVIIKFSNHYTGATKAGLIRGGYHFAQPASSSGAAQANYFLAHSGGWSSDGTTLPGKNGKSTPASAIANVLPSASSMRTWINDFINTYHAKTGRYPLIYTCTSWWKTCAGNTSMFADKCPLVIGRYSNQVGELPAGWSFYTIWQFNDDYKHGGDSDVFNGDYSQLQKLARG